MSSLFGVFSHELLVKEAAATGGKVSQYVVKRQMHGTLHS